MNLQEVIDAINEEWEKKIEAIKAEIRKYNVADFIAVQSVLEIIDKHISGKEKE